MTDIVTDNTQPDEAYTPAFGVLPDPDISSETEIQEQPESAQVPKSKACTEGSLDLQINDAHGDPIANLDFKIFVKNEIVFNGNTDDKGKIPTILNLKIGSIFEIQIKNDIGNYKFSAKGKIEGEENYACLKSPKTRFEFSTYSHNGSPGTAEARKQKIIASHNQKPANKPEITGNPDKKPEIKDDRNNKGNPKASVIDGLRDWYNRNDDKAGIPKTDKTAIEHLNTLIQFMERQAGLLYKTDEVSDAIITKMRKKTFGEPATKDTLKSEGMCTKYVKIALWYAGYGPDNKSIGSNVSPAKLMGPALIAAGFKDVSASLPKVKINTEQPDITFALPGDVIVYKKLSAPNEPGHIDVRTYHGFVSDFFWDHNKRNGFPKLITYTVVGVYRKYSDTLAEARLKAFLKILRSMETEGYSESESYFALPNGKNPETGKVLRRLFTSTDRHPFDKNVVYQYDSKDYYGNVNTSAGAYQLKWTTFNPAKLATGWPISFTPLDQDRAAIYELQGRSSSVTYPKRTALGYIMEGEVERAVNDTKLWKLFDCLPGEGRKVKLSMTELKQAFNTYTTEFSK